MKQNFQISLILLTNIKLNADQSESNCPFGNAKCGKNGSDKCYCEESRTCVVPLYGLNQCEKTSFENNMHCESKYSGENASCGFTLDKVSKCDIPFCKFTNNKICMCLECDDNQFLNENHCHKRIPNCSKQPLDDCITCEDQYVLQKNECFKVISDCKSQNKEFCYECNPGFVEVMGKCFKRIEFCIEQNSDGSCKNCNPGQAFDKDKKCFKQTEYCIHYSDDHTCDKCIDDMFLSNNICTKQVENCDQYENAHCSRCKIDYILSSQDHCVKQTNQCHDQNDTGCNKCISGYNLYDGLCYHSILSCQDQYKLQCNKCDDEQLLFNQKCWRKVEGCEEQENQKCIKCNEGKVLTNQRCVDQIDHCETYQQTNCKICEQGYLNQLDSSSKKHICIQEIENCTMYQSDDLSKCESCSSDQTLIDNGLKCVYIDITNCDAIAEAKEKYNLNIKGCIFPVKGCVAYSSDDDTAKCIQCEYNKFLWKDTCLYKIENCRDQNGQNDCIRCQDGQVQSYGQCIKDITRNCIDSIKRLTFISCTGQHLIKFGSITILFILWLYNLMQIIVWGNIGYESIDFLTFLYIIYKSSYKFSLFAITLVQINESIRNEWFVQIGLYQILLIIVFEQFVFQIMKYQLDLQAKNKLFKSIQNFNNIYNGNFIVQNYKLSNQDNDYNLFKFISISSLIQLIIEILLASIILIINLENQIDIGLFVLFIFANLFLILGEIVFILYNLQSKSISETRDNEEIQRGIAGLNISEFSDINRN